MKSDIFNSTLIMSVHHRKSPPFELGMKRLHDVGFKHIWILESGDCAWGPYNGPKEKEWNMNYAPFSGAMAYFWRDHSLPKNIERLLLLDNDCFIIDPSDTVEYIQTFINERYDLACLSNFWNPMTTEENDIIVPLDLAANHPKLTPGGIAYSIFSRRIWENKREPMVVFFPHLYSEGCHSGFWKDLTGLRPKFGVHRMDIDVPNIIRGKKYRGYSQFERGRWLHLGNLMTAYYQIEQAKPPQCSIIHTDVRRGYFCKYFSGRVHCSKKDREYYISVWDKLYNGEV